MMTRVAQVALEFDGLDTVANISLNGVHLASTSNQHRKYRLDVSTAITNENNVLVVVLSPATAFADAAAARYPYDIGDETFVPQRLEHRAFIRKQQSDFGWDWGPAFAPAGIWRPVRLIQFGAVMLTNVLPTVALVDGRWLVTVRVYYVGGGGGGQYTVTATVGGSKATAQVSEGTDDISGANDAAIVLTVSVDPASVKRWWPAGYGDQPLYNLTVTATAPSGVVVDTAAQTIGFREAMLVEEPIEDAEGPGLSFYFRVNDVPIFAKGSNWIPADAFDNRATDERLRRLLTSAVLAGQNILRVWGGGNYMRDSFWQLCDELGLMIWLDFMHGGARSPRHGAHIAEWAAEVRENVRRIAGE
jgi:beta-mannosidase